ncbi:MAG: hypothetical protein K1X39_02265 [Thermoflexales bacterium]|nr:hypothetical protein [Thermoflexales bacterium]
MTVAIVFLPALGAALGLAFLLFPRLRPYQWLPDLGFSALTTLLAGVMLFGIGWDERLLGAWLPTSTLGELVVLRPDAPGAAVVFALAIAQFASALTRRSASWPRLLAACAFGALSMTAFAYSGMALLIGLGLTDAFTAARRFARGEDAHRVALDAALWTCALLIIVMAAASLADATQYFPLVQFTRRHSGFFAVAVVLRHAVLVARQTRPNGVDADLTRADTDLWASHGAGLGGMILLMRLTQLGAAPLPAWTFAVMLFAALVTLLRAVFDGHFARASRRALSGILALGTLSAAAWQAVPLAATVIGFVLGTGLLRRRMSELLAHATYRRLVPVALGLGAATLLGLPLTAGFLGRAGALTALFDGASGPGPVVTAMAVTLAFAALTAFATRAWEEGLSQRPEVRLDATLALAGVLLLALTALALGVAPGLMDGDLTAAVSSLSTVGWACLGIGIAAGALLWRFRDRLRARLPASTGAVGDAISNVLSFRWALDPLAAAAGRLSQPLGELFVVLESEGALLWTLALALFVLLTSRSPGP